MKNEVSELDIELKELEIESKKRELNKKTKVSPVIVGVLTVLLSVLGSYITTKLEIKNSKEEFSTELVNEILSDEIIVSKRKIEFLNKAGLLKTNSDSIISAFTDLSLKSASKYYEVGYYLMKLNKTNKAIIKFNEAVELNPSYAEALNILAYCYYLKGKNENSLLTYKKGLSTINKAIQLDSINLHSHYWKGRLLYELNDYDKAYKIFENIISKEQDEKLEYFVESHFFLGDILRLKGEEGYCDLYLKSARLGSKNSPNYFEKYCN